MTAVKLADLPDKRPDPSSLPIPDDAQVSEAWSPLMRELAAHIGAQAVLQLVDRYGGMNFYVPVEPHGWHAAKIIGADRAKILSQVFGRENLQLPVGKLALDQARRAGIIARVRAKTLTLNEAAWILRMKRRWIWHLVNKTDEGKGVDLATAPALPSRTRQLSLFEE